MIHYRIQHTDSAKNDLMEAWLYLADDSIEAADRMLDIIGNDARSLTTHPGMGRARDELEPGLRSWPTSTPYILFYFVKNDAIVIARVLHHARDIPSIDTWPAH
jgi:plasmid stabilization system protein ParE